MVMLYAPTIQQVPAFSDKIKVYFKHNPAVDTSTYSNLYLILKDMNSNLITTEAIQLTIDEDNINLAACNLPFGIVDGEFYKCQIAYTAEGSWSEVSITRYVAVKPTLSINGLVGGGNLNLITNNIFKFTYTKGSKAETLYQYRYSLIDNGTKEIIQTSDWQDFYKEADNSFILYEELKTVHPYILRLEGITINGLSIDTVEYYIASGAIQECAFTDKGETKIKSTNKGYINIFINPLDISYKYQLLRKENNNNHLELIAEFQGELNWKDYTVEQGVKYEYLIRNINEDKTKITKTLSLGSAMADFEDMYLSDADKMLTIKFNPQVSSIKNTVLEQKTDTIGSQYPFFFRNGNVNYKEIPISGLISYHMDDQELFMTAEEIAAAGSSEDWMRSTDLTPDNFTSERKFKMEVLDWLTNGKPKLFRSPAEGNYVVRLMNTSLSPNTTVGRMLHTFSTTGYECMSTNYITMVENQVVKAPEAKAEIKEVIESKTYDGYSTPVDLTASGVSLTDITLQVDKVDVGSTCIILDNTITCYLSSSIFTTPPGAIYTSVKVPVAQGNPATLTYRKQNNEEINTISFPVNGQIKLYSVESEQQISDIIGEDGNIDYVYGLAVEKIELDEKDKTSESYLLHIGDNIIDCSDGQFRYYSNFNLDGDEITKGNGIRIMIYGKFSNIGGN